MNLNESDAAPLTDRVEVEECRRQLRLDRIIKDAIWDQWLSESEQYDSAAELGAARDIELWGEAPFEDD